MAKDKQTKRRMYQCEDCQARRYVNWIELNRAGKPACYGCGSTRLELVTKEAMDERARLQRERIVGSDGSLKLASNLDNPHRKVT